MFIHALVINFFEHWIISRSTKRNLYANKEPWHSKKNLIWRDIILIYNSYRSFPYFPNFFIANMPTKCHTGGEHWWLLLSQYQWFGIVATLALHFGNISKYWKWDALHSQENCYGHTHTRTHKHTHTHTHWTVWLRPLLHGGSHFVITKWLPPWSKGRNHLFVH